MKYLLLLLAIAGSTVVYALNLDQRDPNYQKSVHEMAMAQQHILKAMEHIQNMHVYYEHPGLMPEKDLGALQRITDNYTLLLTPETKRVESIELTPDLSLP